MPGAVVWLVLLLVAVTVFALSNTGAVTVMFWQWPIYTGSLALVIIGAGVLGALLTLLPALLRQHHLGWRIRDLERRLRAHEAVQAPSVPPSSPEGGTPGPVEDTRRFT
jgi:uncharacterized integral membrane protein